MDRAEIAVIAVLYFLQSMLVIATLRQPLPPIGSVPVNGHLETMAVTSTAEGNIVTLKWVGTAHVQLFVTVCGANYTEQWKVQSDEGLTFSVRIPEPSAWCEIKYGSGIAGMLAIVNSDGEVTTRKSNRP